jgi:3-polyprenyl-4-hydroxybenzoate decarboxylase
MVDKLAGYAPQLQPVADGRILPAASKYYQQPKSVKEMKL